jgi:hypothetical protein
MVIFNKGRMNILFTMQAAVVLVPKLVKSVEIVSVAIILRLAKPRQPATNTRMEDASAVTDTAISMAMTGSTRLTWHI